MVDRGQGKLWDDDSDVPSWPDRVGSGTSPPRHLVPEWPPPRSAPRPLHGSGVGIDPGPRQAPADPYAPAPPQDPYAPVRPRGVTDPHAVADPHAPPGRHSWADLYPDGRYSPAVDRAAPPGRSGRRRLDANRWHWLLFLPVVVPLLPPLYNRMEPTLGGVPFFYWGQLSFALLSSTVIAIVHAATRGR